MRRFIYTHTHTLSLDEMTDSPPDQSQLCVQYAICISAPPTTTSVKELYLMKDGQVDLVKKLREPHKGEVKEAKRLAESVMMSSGLKE